jgi:integrase
MDVVHELEADNNGKPFTATTEDTGTVAELLDQYFDHLERIGRSPTTVHAYRRYARIHIIPVIGDKLVAELTALDLDTLYAGMARKKKGASTIRQAHAIMSGALKQAGKWDLVDVNVARRATPPPASGARVTPPTTDEVLKLVRAAEERDPVMAAFIMLAAITGARRGELCALHWRDVDLAKGTLHIERSLVDLPGLVVEKDTKTHAARTIALGDAGVALLAAHRGEVEARAKQGDTQLAPSAYVFSPNLDGAIPIRPDSVTGFFTRLRDDLDLPHVHLHSLRHWAATQLAATGTTSVRTVAGRLGHADASVTMKVYSAFFPAADVEAADHLGRALNPG